MNILTNYSEYKIQKGIERKKVNSTDNSKTKTAEYKPDFFDKISEKVVNKRDINDMVTMPRAIFKGYLCFTAGTTINSIAALLKNNKFSKGLKIAGSIISIYGTYNFVKPFLLRNQDLTKNEK